MSEQTPSQAEGGQPETPSHDEPQSPDARDVPRTTPSQAEGEDTDQENEETDAEASEEWESGWSGP